MMLHPKVKRLTDKVGTLSAEARKNLAGLASVLMEIPDPHDDIVTMHAPRMQEKRMTRKEKIRTALGIIGFLALYILANSTAPVVWTQNGMLPLH